MADEDKVLFKCSVCERTFRVPAFDANRAQCPDCEKATEGEKVPLKRAMRKDVERELKELNSDVVLRYMKRRDLIILGCVLFYMFGPAIYNRVESLNDIHLNFSSFDPSRFHSGSELRLYKIEDEIHQLREDMKHDRRLSWPAVFDDLSR